MTAWDHLPVLRDAAMSHLQPGPGKRYLDGTYGRGGHTAALLAAGAQVLALDLDSEAVVHCVRRAATTPRLRCLCASFRDPRAALAQAGWRDIDGVLLDLGVSSPQLDDPAQGFSHRADGPLDLRFDRTSGEPAQALLARLSERDLADLLWRYGEERAARRIARALVDARARGAMRRTGDLRAAVEAAVRAGPGRTAALSRVFQALRIAVNDELGALSDALAGALDALRPGGVAVIISYHSLEDRLVKQWIERESRDCVCPPRTPACRCGHRRRLKPLTRGAQRPTPEEIAANPRARSGRLRAARRL